MKTVKKEISVTDKNIFNDIHYKNYEVNQITCSKNEFVEMLNNKEYNIVNVIRNKDSEFLFKSWDNEAKYAILNTAFGLDNISYADHLDRNDSTNDVVIIEN